jgi:hypothetical protein
MKINTNFSVANTTHLQNTSSSVQHLNAQSNNSQSTLTKHASVIATFQVSFIRSIVDRIIQLFKSCLSCFGLFNKSKPAVPVQTPTLVPSAAQAPQSQPTPAASTANPNRETPAVHIQVNTSTIPAQPQVARTPAPEISPTPSTPEAPVAPVQTTPSSTPIVNPSASSSEAPQPSTIQETPSSQPTNLAPTDSPPDSSNLSVPTPAPVSPPIENSQPMVSTTQQIAISSTNTAPQITINGNQQVTGNVSSTPSLTSSTALTSQQVADSGLGLSNDILAKLGTCGPNTLRLFQGFAAFRNNPDPLTVAPVSNENPLLDLFTSPSIVSSSVNNNNSLARSSTQDVSNVFSSPCNELPETVIQFYKGKGAILHGLSLTAIHSEFERNERYLPLMFPTDKQDTSYPYVPVLNSTLIQNLRNDSLFGVQLHLSFTLTLMFYGFMPSHNARGEMDGIEPTTRFDQRSAVWLTSKSSHFSHITRILYSLRILGLEKQSKLFLAALQKVAKANPKTITKLTLVEWTAAANGVESPAKKVNSIQLFSNA